jgi:hypothetical protein
VVGPAARPGPVLISLWVSEPVMDFGGFRHGGKRREAFPWTTVEWPPVLTTKLQPTNPPSDLASSDSTRPEKCNSSPATAALTFRSVSFLRHVELPAHSHNICVVQSVMRAPLTTTSS